MASTALTPVMEAAMAEVRRRTELRLQQKLLPTLQPLSGRGGWYPMVSEPFTGAWQRNVSVSVDTALSFHAVFACTTLIMGDLGKLTLRLVLKSSDGIWEEAENPAYSPVLRKPNRYQNSTQFSEAWTASLLNTGNTYVLKQRDNRGVVVEMYVLDPNRVTPLVAVDGSVYYDLKRDDLSGLAKEQLIVPASEIIHDRINTLLHPLIGLPPIFACAASTQQGLSIQNNSSKMFSNGSVPGGVLTAPGEISDEAAARLKEYWDTNFSGDNIGKVAVLGDGLNYQPMAFKAVDMQLVDQLKLSAEQVCSCYHVPPYLVDIGPPPPYANVGPLIQKYHAVCLQRLMVGREKCLDEGMGLGPDFGNRYGTEYDPDDLMWLDSEAKSKAAQDGIGSGGMSPNEARKRYYGLGPVKGGESPLAQQQYYSLAALAERDANKPFAKPEPAPAAPKPDTNQQDMPRAASLARISRKAVEEFCAA